VSVTSHQKLRMGPWESGVGGLGHAPAAANDRCIYGGEDCETDPCLSPGGRLMTRKPVSSPVPPESSISLRPARK
jgi:hypothetical protein